MYNVVVVICEHSVLKTYRLPNVLRLLKVLVAKRFEIENVPIQNENDSLDTSTYNKKLFHKNIKVLLMWDFFCCYQFVSLFEGSCSAKLEGFKSSVPAILRGQLLYERSTIFTLQR